MKLTPVTCEKCGAPLKVREDARFVTCAHCETQLRVERTEGTVSTVVLEKQVEAIADQVDELRAEAEVARLDREWEQEREGLMIRTKEGGRVVPSESRGRLVCYVGVFMAVACLFAWTRMRGDDGDDNAWVLLVASAAVFFFALAAGLNVMQKARAYAAAEARYLDERERLRGRSRG